MSQWQGNIASERGVTHYVLSSDKHLTSQSHSELSHRTRYLQNLRRDTAVSLGECREKWMDIVYFCIQFNILLWLDSGATPETKAIFIYMLLNSNHFFKQFWFNSVFLQRTNFHEAHHLTKDDDSGRY